MDNYTARIGVTGLEAFKLFNEALRVGWDYYAREDMAFGVTLSRLMKDSPRLRVLLFQIDTTR